MKSYLILLIALTSSILQAQNHPNKSSLKMEEIMAGNDFIGHQPEQIRWTIDNSSIIFDWNKCNQIGNSSYNYTLSTKEIDSNSPHFFENNAIVDRPEMNAIEVYSQNGNLYKYNRKNKAVTLLLNTPSRLWNVQQFKKSNRVYFQIDLNIYTYDISSGSINVLFSFVKGDEPNKDKIHSNLEQQQEELFDFIRDKHEIEDWNQRKIDNEVGNPKLIYIGNSSVNNIQISANQNYLTYRLNDYPSNTPTHVEHHITNDGYTETTRARSKVSKKDPNHSLLIYNIEKDSIYSVDFSTLSNIRKKPTYLAEYLSDDSDIEKFYENDRNIIMHSINYSKNRERNVFDVRSYDNKDRWVVSVELSSGKITEHQNQHDEAWIGGPGISSWNMVEGTLDWLDNETFYFQSEETGFSHLYTYNIPSKEKKQLTNGNWEVHSVQLSKSGERFYLTANKNHPGNREFYHLVLSNLEMIPILTKDGNYEVTVSPDEKHLAIRYSTKTKPWELYYALNKPKSNLVQVTSSTTSEFNAYKWYSPSIIGLIAEDGTTVNARLYNPNSETKNGAAVIFVHGAGYLQNAHNYWSGYYREYMFHNLLRDNGYTVIDIDYRASKGYGRDFRTAIYRHMGGLDLSDQLLGRQFLIDSMEINPDKVGIYGGSYGGFITLMALLTKPNKFACGAAIRSVTDWEHYNHEYTTNILNYPTSDPEAYKKSSPIYFAENLTDKLLILHGMVDDNVQYQDVVRLTQRFIELGIQNWEIVGYPVEAHGFVKTTSWIDEYSRILNLFNNELLK